MISLRVNKGQYVGLSADSGTNFFLQAKHRVGTWERIQVVAPSQGVSVRYAAPNSQVALKFPAFRSRLENRKLATVDKNKSFRPININMANEPLWWELMVFEPRAAPGLFSIKTDDSWIWQAEGCGGGLIKAANMPAAWWRECEQFQVHYIGAPRPNTVVAVQAYNDRYFAVSSPVARWDIQIPNAGAGAAISWWEKWTVHPTSYGSSFVMLETMSWTPPPGSTNARLLSTDPAGSDVRVASLISDRRDHAVWEVVPVGNTNYVTFKNRAKSCFLQAVNGGGGVLECVGAPNDTWKLFRILPAF